MPGYASRKDLIDERKKLISENEKLIKEVSEAKGTPIIETETYCKIINNPKDYIPVLRFKCVCCAEVEVKALAYNQPLCAHCHRPMTRLKTWTS